MNELANRVCVPCKGGIPPLKGKELKALQNQLGNGWNVINEHHLKKKWKFDDFESFRHTSMQFW